MRNSELLGSQRRFMERLATYLARNPAARIVVHRYNYTIKEKEHALFYEAKKKYFMSRNGVKLVNYTAEDSVRADRISIKDTLFVQYLNKSTNGASLFTAQEKCLLLIGPALINSRLAALNRSRENAFMQYFIKKDSEKQVKIMAGSNTIPFNGFSYYKIEYIGELPEYLRSAYMKMNELDELTPRKEFKAERKKARRNSDENK